MALRTRPGLTTRTKWVSVRAGVVTAMPCSWVVALSGIEADARSALAAGVRRDSHVDRTLADRQQLPELCGAPMTEDGSFAAGEHRRHPPPLIAPSAMADGVDAAMDPVQTIGANPPGDS
jgi:hypothetical protein